MLEGFYQVRFQVDDAVGRSVMYAHGGSMLGGNSAFAHYGTYTETDGVVISEITSHRHNDDPNYQSLLGSDIATIDVRGRADGDVYRFEGGSPQMPGAVFRSVMTPISDQIVAPVEAVGEGGIVNGLYSIHIRMLDGVAGGLTGVMLLHDGRILGGDAFFYYLGTYTSASGRWKAPQSGAPPAKSEHPIFGGHEVGIGCGTCDTSGALLEATALAGSAAFA